MFARTTVALLLGSFVSITAWAQDKPFTQQQERMKACNAQASKQELKGGERKAFMSDCLKAGGDDKLTAQQQRMKSCNEQAGKKQLKGDERQGFMSRCLKGDKVANSQQERMKTCNEQAGKKSLKGDERKAFMSSCLRNDAPHAATGGSARSKTR